MKILLLAAVAFVGSPLLAQAEDCELSGTHLCCPGCTKAVGKVLSKVKGVTNAKCDTKANKVTFTASNAKVGGRALRLLANNGFYGKATVGGKAVRLPRTGAKKGEKADSKTITRMHLCCGACVAAATKAAKTVKGVEGVSADRKKRSITVTGKQFSVEAVMRALHKEGLAGRAGPLPKRKKKKGKKKDS